MTRPNMRVKNQILATEDAKLSCLVLNYYKLYVLALWQHFSDCLGALGFELVAAQVDGGQRPVDQVR